MKRILKSMTSVILIFGFSLSLFSCGKESETSPTAEEKTHTVIDHAGHEVELPNEIKRMVVCDIYPLPAMLAAFFDSAEKIVGMAPQSYSSAQTSLLGKLYPEILNAKTGFINGTTVNIEELLNLKPDVVFVNSGNDALYKEVTNAGMKAVSISAGKWNYDALQTMNEWTKTLSEVLNEEANETYEKVKAYGEKIVGEVREKLSAVSPQNCFFLFQYSQENRQTAGNPSFGRYWAEIMNGENAIQENTPANSKPFSMEELYTLNPDVIFITNFTNVTAKEILSGKVFADDWSGLKAVQNKKVYKLPQGLYRFYTAGADTPLMIEWLAKTLYPELFEDLNLQEEAKAFYKEILNTDLSDEDAAAMFD